jgi:peptidoglycan/LPS O-acetylase OafA/YrhL
LRRIAPAYIFIVLSAAVLLAPFSRYAIPQYVSNAGFWKYLGYNLLLMNFRAATLPGVFQGNPMPAVNGSLWTIKVEVGFYIAVPVIVWLVRRYGPRRVLGAVFLGSVAWHLIFGALGAHDPLGLYARLAKQLPGQLSFFAGGAWAYYRVLEGRSPPFLLALAGAAAYAATSGFAFEAVAPFAVVALVSWAAVAGPRLPPLGKYGDFSYGIYLYHFPIVQALVAVGMFAWSPYAAVLVTIVAVTCCSVASWYLLESPALAGRAQHALRARRSLAS